MDFNILRKRNNPAFGPAANSTSNMKQSARVGATCQDELTERRQFRLKLVDRLFQHGSSFRRELKFIAGAFFEMRVCELCADAQKIFLDVDQQRVQLGVVEE